MASVSICTIADLVSVSAKHGGCLAGIEGAPLAGADLGAHIGDLAEDLRAAGLGGSRITLVLPNGRAFASALLATMMVGTAAPLNPSYRTGELRARLQDLGAEAIIVEPRGSAEAAAAARSLGMRVVTIDPSAERISPAVGDDRWHTSLRAGRKHSRIGPEDVALVLHTSGTTARSKIVALTQKQLCAAAQNVADTLGLSPADRCLNVMPLFHIHGIVAGTLASLLAGSTVTCAPQFDPLRFFRWMQKTRPTWYSAVPSIHQAVLALAGAHCNLLADVPLRFIRSCSAPLPSFVLDGLEQTFATPVIEAYGMTEAAHQLASNPLPPRRRKPGSVGMATGAEIGVMPEGGAQLLPPAHIGEIVVRGRTVIAGYEVNPQADREAFCDGWLRTGDQGYVDAEGYVWITGRLKELINRGGEKISPIEIEAALLSHPAVASAAAFPIPDRLMGEEIGAAVVLNTSAGASEKELTEHCSGALADFKVPRNIRFLASLPCGATGKIKRAGLAAALGLA
jgi:acyl-CoA synthetase (AMP-forming)/AMP-acid ligase II